MSKWFDVEEVRAIVRDQLAEQGLPLHVEDEETRRTLARLLTTGREDTKKATAARTTAA